MNTELIEQYIQFAIDNGYILYGYNTKVTKKIYSIKKYKNKITINNIFDINFIEIITSKEFINSIARGFYLKNHKVKIDTIYDKLIDNITIEQAIAIRDGTLDLFIKEILG